jgi:CRISPR-associated endonuclease Cas2
MPWLITYDIEDDKLRLKTANRILADGFIRLQYSVFAGEASDTLMDELLQWFEKEVPNITNSSNRVLILPCTQRQLDNAKIFGAPPDDWKEMLDPPNTLII